MVTPSTRPLQGHVLSRAWGGLSGLQVGERSVAGLFERERSRLLVGPRGAGGEEAQCSQLGIQSLKENTLPGLGFTHPGNEDER